MKYIILYIGLHLAFCSVISCRGENYLDNTTKEINLKQIKGQTFLIINSGLDDNKTVYKLKICLNGKIDQPININNHHYSPGIIETCVNREWYSKQSTLELSSESHLTAQDSLSIQYTFYFQHYADK